jgi:EAL domain-containing protein (putative c-di-GMP-specific phosphodiesterase class I)
LIALDDFGVQASNLNRLAELPIDIIKLDKSLVQRVVSDKKTLEVVRSTAIMAGKLGIKTIAEGVETPAQGRVIHHMSSVQQQGFLHAKPMKTSDVFDNLIKIGYDLRNPIHLGY